MSAPLALGYEGRATRRLYHCRIVPEVPTDLDFWEVRLPDPHLIEAYA